MTEDDLYLLLRPLAGGQVYPYVAPLGSDGQPSISPPWVIFSLISDVTADVLCGQAESGISVQVDVSVCPSNLMEAAINPRLYLPPISSVFILEAIRGITLLHSLYITDRYLSVMR